MVAVESLVSVRDEDGDTAAAVALQAGYAQCALLCRQRAEVALADRVAAAALKEEGNTFFRAGEAAAAVACYREASERNPLDALLQSNLAAALLQQSESEQSSNDSPLEADAIIRRTMPAAEQAQALRTIRANHLELAQRAVDAARAFVELDGRCVTGYYRLGCGLLGLHEWSAATTALEKALELAPNGVKGAKEKLREATAGASAAAAKSDGTEERGESGPI